MRCSTDKKVKERTRDTHKPRRIVLTGDWRASTKIQATAPAQSVRASELAVEKYYFDERAIIQTLPRWRGRQLNHISVTRITFLFCPNHRTIPNAYYYCKQHNRSHGGRAGNRESGSLEFSPMTK